MGRPKIEDPEKRRDIVILKVRGTRSDREQIRANARAANLQLAVFARARCLGEPVKLIGPRCDPELLQELINAASDVNAVMEVPEMMNSPCKPQVRRLLSAAVELIRKSERPKG